MNQRETRSRFSHWVNCLGRSAVSFRHKWMKFLKSLSNLPLYPLGPNVNWGKQCPQVNINFYFLRCNEAKIYILLSSHASTENLRQSCTQYLSKWYLQYSDLFQPCMIVGGHHLTHQGNQYRKVLYWLRFEKTSQQIQWLRLISPSLSEGTDGFLRFHGDIKTRRTIKLKIN